MGDGFISNKGVGIATNSFTVDDCHLLASVLTTKFGLNCKVLPRNGQSRIIIHSSSVKLLQELVLPFVHPSMLYKLHL